MAITSCRNVFIIFFAFQFMHCFEHLKSNRTFSIDYDHDTFLMDGKPFRYISGSIHYSRIPSYYWRDRLEKMKAAGLNAVQVYVPWNFHQMEENQYDFDGDKDFVGFIKTAQDVGLYVVLRSGPYICGEWDFGGFPPFILAKNPETVFRTMDPTYIKYVDIWLEVLYPKIKPLLYNNGGPVLMVQIENEYGSYVKTGGYCDHDYMRYLRSKAISLLGENVLLFTTDGNHDDPELKCGTLEGVYATVDFKVTSCYGFQIENEYGSYFACDYDYLRYLRQKAITHLGDDVVLFTTDGSGDGYLQCGTLQGVYSTVDFGITMDPQAAFKPQRDFEPRGPFVNSEFYTGWLDHWGFAHSTVPLDKVANSLDALLDYGANINMYMFEGGTNFGYWNGANYPAFLPVPTSYDYDGPLTESGDVTDKYLAVRQVISKYVKGMPLPIPRNTPKMAYGKIQMKLVGTIFDLLDKLRRPDQKPLNSTYPVYMQAFGQYQGYALYRHVFKEEYPTPCNLTVTGIRDRGYVMIDQAPIGILIREHNESLIFTARKGQILDILVENQGHINFGSGINNNTKGIIKNVTVSGTVLTDWQMIPVSPEMYNPASNTTRVTKPSYSLDGKLMTPSLYMGQLPSFTESADTYLDPTGWNKGQAIIYNSKQYNLGRYWPVAGPQVRLFVPKPFLAGDNQRNSIIMFELISSPCGQQTNCTLEFKDQPLINATAHGPYSKQMSRRIGAGFDWNTYMYH